MVLGVDTGGTFTDFVLWRDGVLTSFKTLSTPDDPSRSIFDGIVQLGLERELERGELSVVHGSTLAFAVVLAMTCVASESAAAWKPSHARWSTLPSVSGASIVDGCTSSPSRSRVVLSYSARVSRGVCEVAGMPGVHTVGSTGGGTTVVPAVPLPAVPVPTVLPVPTLPAVPLPVLAPDPELCFPVPIEPSQPARSTAPTMIVLFQVFMTLTSVPGG